MLLSSDFGGLLTLEGFGYCTADGRFARSHSVCVDYAARMRRRSAQFRLSCARARLFLQLLIRFALKSAQIVRVAALRGMSQFLLLLKT